MKYAAYIALAAALFLLWFTLTLNAVGATQAFRDVQFPERITHNRADWIIRHSAGFALGQWLAQDVK